MKHKNLVRVFLLALLLMLPIEGLEARAWVSDNGNGTYTNPIMWGDYPDNDVIRVGDTYYMASTSMHVFPGCPIMSSKDLVNWTYESYAVERMEGDKYNLINGNVYDEGPWATSLRYHGGKFYLLFNINGDTAFVSIAESAKGPWTLYKLEDELYDPGLFFDDDGKVYVVHGQGDLYISDLEIVDEKTGELSITSKKEPGAWRNGKKLFSYSGGAYNEGSHVYKIEDYYYILSSPTWSAGSKKEIVTRTKDLKNGPFETRDMITSFMNFDGNGIHQGGIVDVPQGAGKEPEWWSIIFQDRGKLGRVPTLQPVYWEDGWPYMGEKGMEGQKAVVTHKKPNIPGLTENIEPSAPLTSDDFSSEKLGLQWQWNHNPNEAFYSLTERPGYMRLKTATVTASLNQAQNTLTQRVIGPDCTATVKMDISHMTEGDMAGLAVMQRDYNYIGISYESGAKNLVLYDSTSLQAEKPLSADVKEIWLRAKMPRHEYRVEYFYSLDGENFERLGGRYDMRYATYVGMRFGIYNYATLKRGGYIDVDSFTLTTTEKGGNQFGLNEKIDAERYDDQYYVLDKDLQANKNMRTRSNSDDVCQGFDLSVENLKDGDWITFDRIDFGTGDAKWLNVRVASAGSGNTLEIHKDAKDGPVLTTLEIPNTGNDNIYVNAFSDLKEIPKGVQKIVLVFKGANSNLCKINWLMFGTGEYPEIPEIPQGLTAVLKGTNSVEISWTDAERAIAYDLTIGDKIVSNADSSFTETGLEENSAFPIKIRAKNAAGCSAWSQEIQVKTPRDPNLIPRTEMKATASSQEISGEDGAAGNVLDGDPGTIWHTKWSGGSDTLPYHLDLNLGNTYDVCKMVYVPRSGGGNGSASLYNIYTSMDGKNYTLVKQNGVWADDGQEKTAEFAPVQARYLRFEILRGRNGYGSAAEIRVYHGGSLFNLQLANKKLAVSSGDAKAAVDGDPDTVWKADSGDEERSFKVDLGIEYNLTKLCMEWPQEADARYKVEVSADGKLWNEAADHTDDPMQTKKKTDELTARQVRYVKITFPAGGDAQIGELGIFGYKNPMTEKELDENLALNRPVKTDSQQAGDPAVFGNDGLPGTCWDMGDANESHNWQVDLGGKYDLTGSKLIFDKDQKMMKYKIEVSQNGKEWVSVLDRMENTGELDKECEDSWTADAVSSVRVTVQSMANETTAFGEFEVYGTRSKQTNAAAYAELAGKNQVKDNSDFQVQFAVFGAQDMASQKVTIQYPSDMFELKEAVLADERLELRNEEQIQPGNVSYEVSCKDGKTLSGRIAILNLTFHAGVSASGTITATDIQVAQSETSRILLEDVSKHVLAGGEGTAVDKAALKKLIDAYDNLVESDYTSESWDVLKQALAAAREVLDDSKATQADVSGAEEELESAREGLVTLAFDLAPAGGFYNGRQNVTIDTKSSQMEFYYTLDGSDPTENSIPCDGIIALPYGVIHLKVAAFIQGEKVGKTVSADYMVNDSKNLALNKTASSPDDAQWGDFPLESSVDGDRDSWWTGDPGLSELTYELDFGEDTTFNSLHIVEYVRTHQECRIIRYTMEYFDGSEWKEIDQYEASAPKKSNMQLFNKPNDNPAEFSDMGSVFETVTASKIRFRFTSDGQLSLREVEIYYNRERPADTEALSSAVKRAEEMDPENYQDVSEFLEALNYAKALLKQGGLTENDQSGINEAEKKLESAMELLVLKPALLTQLEEMLQRSEKIEEELYMQEGISAFRKAVSDAKALKADETLTILDQEKVDFAVQALEKAMNSLVKKADLTELKREIESAGHIDLTKYTADSAGKLQTVLQAAKALAERQDLTEAEQGEIDRALQTLRDAVRNLKENKPIEEPAKPVRVTKVRLDRNKAVLRVKSTLKLKASITPGNAENKKVTFKSSNPKVAKVSQSGKITAVRAGKARITATASDGKKTASCKVTVKKKLPKPKFTKTKVSVKRNRTLKLRKYLRVYDTSEEMVNWSSKNKKIVSVNEKGEVRGKKKGTAVIVTKNRKTTLKIKVIVK